MARAKSKDEAVLSTSAQLATVEPGIRAVPMGVTSICAESGSKPSLFKTLFIPSSVTHIEGLAHIANCSYIIVDLDNPAYCSMDGVVFTRDKEILIAFPQAGAPIRHNKPCYDYRVPLGTKAIADNAFADNHTLETVILPNGLTDIGYGAFSNCKALFTVSLPDSVLHLGPHCFAGSNRINRLYFPAQIAPLYTSNLSSGIIIEIADGVPLDYDYIPNGFPIKGTPMLYNALIKPILLCHNNPSVINFAEEADYHCIQNYDIDPNGIVWSKHDLLCFPHSWDNDRYAIPANTKHIYAVAFSATKISYFYSKKNIKFFPLYTPLLFTMPGARKSGEIKAYEVHPGTLPKCTYLPEDDPYFFITTTGISYETLMGNHSNAEEAHPNNEDSEPWDDYDTDLCC